MELIEGVKYLVNDVLAYRTNSKLDIHFEIDDLNQKIILRGADGSIYTEEVFPFHNPLIDLSDQQHLNMIILQVEPINKFQGNIVENLASSDLPLLKILHFLINEFWIVHDIPLDKHQRVTSNSIDPIWIFAQHVPLSEWIMQALLIRLKGQDFTKTKTLHFTCDYDILELWKGLKRMHILAKIGVPLRRGDFSNFYKELVYFLGEISGQATNPLLNMKMFVPAENAADHVKIKNTAFWHIHSNNPIFDHKNNFNSLKVLKFVQLLTEHHVEHALHPCYGSAGNIELMKLQASSFKRIFGFDADKGRYHYLKCLFPDHFETYLITNIREDYSYCFPDKLLFRGGRSGPIKMWDKSNNIPSRIISYPLTIMESTLSDYMKLSQEEALKAALRQINLSLTSSGYCNLLWHNRSMYKNDHPGNYHPELFKQIIQGLSEMNLIRSEFEYNI
jgi:hypothetical protein